MSAQRAGEFFARVARDSVLEARVRGARSGEDLLSIARREGFVFELADLASPLATDAGGSEAEEGPGHRLLRHCRETFGGWPAMQAMDADETAGR